MLPRARYCGRKSGGARTRARNKARRLVRRRSSEGRSWGEARVVVRETGDGSRPWEVFWEVGYVGKSVTSGGMCAGKDMIWWGKLQYSTFTNPAILRFTDINYHRCIRSTRQASHGPKYQMQLLNLIKSAPAINKTRILGAL